MAAELRKILGQMPDSFLSLRDRAVLTGAFRRSELVAIDAEDFQESEEGMTIIVRRSKTDQKGQGRVVGIPRSRGRRDVSS